ncbi:MAG: hypothetical protein KAG14_01740, partial [Mycoplasmataceae bacterium]|nr:hypothetical protein [Mycoplasmataceae bacterium]
MINYIEINNNKYKLGKKTFITSDSNSQGKTTLIRSLLFGIGFIQSDTFVDGTSIKDIKVVIDWDVKNRNYKFTRTKRVLNISMNNTLIKTFNTTTTEYIDDLNKWFDMLFNFEGSIMPSILFSNYIDQQYGNHVINKGRTGFLPNKMKFNLSNLIMSLDVDYKRRRKLEDKRAQLNSFSKNIEYIGKYSREEKIQIDLDFSNDKKDISKLDSLLMRKRRMETRLKYMDAKKTVFDDFSIKLLDMNLIYKDKDGINNKMTMDNIQSSYDMQYDLIKDEIKNIKKAAEAIMS